MTAMMPVGARQYTDGNGRPLVAGMVAFAQPNTGGATLLPIWADERQQVQLSNPVPLDASGRPFSGGSQQSIWGTGQYQEFVYDFEGNLQSSAMIDVPFSSMGGTINGSVTINGSGESTLTVSGDITSTNGNITGAMITSTGKLQAGSANFTDPITTNGINDSNEITTPDLTVTNTATINNLAVNGTFSSAGVLDVDGVNSSGPITGTTGTFSGALQAASFNIGGTIPVVGAQGGQATITSSPAMVTFPVAFNSVISVVATPVFTTLPTDIGGFFAAIGSVSNTGCQITVQNFNGQVPSQVSQSITVNWLAIGT